MGPEVKKSGPKGRCKAKGVMSGMFIELSEDEPYISADAIARKIREETGVKLTAGRI